MEHMANLGMIPLKPERKAQREQYAKRRGQEPAAALDMASAAYLGGSIETLPRPSQASIAATKM
jgi:hypothetical protein